MSDLLCCASKKGAVIISNSQRQSIYSADKHIVAGPDDRELSDLVDFGGIDFLSQHKKYQDVFVGSRKSLTRGGENVGLCDFISDTPKNVSKKLRRPPKNLSDMLIFLFNAITRSIYYQFGFVDKYGAKTLFSPESELYLEAAEYCVNGSLSAARSANNSEFYNLLVRALDNCKTLPNKKTKSAVRDIIERYLDYEHGVVERFTVNRYLKDMKVELQRIAVPRLVPKKQYSLQQRLDRDFQPRDSMNLLISLRRLSNQKQIQDMAYHFQKEIGAHVRTFNKLRYISVSGDIRDIKKLHGLIAKRKYSVFSKRGRQMLAFARGAAFCHGVYIPEILSAHQSNIIPIKTRLKRKLWNLDNIASYDANNTTEGTGAKVAVIDTGVDYEHDELRGNFGSNLGYDFVQNNNDPMDLNCHGTHVAGIIGGSSTGVAPECTMYALRVLNSKGVGTVDNILLAVDWCLSNDIDIANLSLGSATYLSFEEEVYDTARRYGLVCVAAAGNEGYGPSYPASYESTISVAAVDRFNEHADFSNIYHTNNISAPGVGILSALPGDDYGTLSGTSMATPHISGVCGLIGSLKGIDKDYALSIIEKTALELGRVNDPENFSKYGSGLVQADKAVSNLRRLKWIA